MSESTPATPEVEDLRAQQTPAKYILFVVVTAVFTVIDQVTKILVQKNVDPLRDEIQLIDGFLSIVHAENPGAAFGMFGGSEHRMLFFAVFTVVALVVLGRMLYELPKDDRFQNVALGLISSGAVGNAIDRVQKQSVTDFIRVYTENPSAKAFLLDNFGTAEWPSFNVADAAIVIGMGMFAIHWFFLEKDESGDKVESADGAEAAKTEPDAQ